VITFPHRFSNRLEPTVKKLFLIFSVAVAFTVLGGAVAPRHNSTFAAEISVAPKTAPGAGGNIWPQDSSEVKPDPNAVFGRLDNGLRYVLLSSKGAPGRASLQLVMRAGSLMEAEDQRGMAHFLEHMSFNGTKNFPAGEMVEYFQHLGMEFGPHTNAYTDWEKTVYVLALPRTDERVVGDGLKWLRDVLDGMTLDKQEIERERRVILAEILARNSSTYRGIMARYGFLIPETLVPRRAPAGEVKTVSALAPNRFADFYETWYTPARATIVAVGDFQTKALESLIRQKFQDAKARRGEQADPSFGKVTTVEQPIAMLHSDPDATVATVTLSVVRPDLREPDSFARRQKMIVRYLAQKMLNARFEKTAAAQAAPYLAANATFENIYALADANNLMAVCRPGQWKGALRSLEQEFRQTVQYGFNDAEFSEAVASVAAEFQSAADQQSTRQPAVVAGGIANSLGQNLVVTRPSDECTHAKLVLATLNKVECEELLRKSWDSQNVRIMVQGNVQLAGDGSEQILAAYRESCASAVQPKAEEKLPKFAYSDFGPPSRITSRTDYKELDFVEAVLSNNVHLNIKRTPYEKNAVRVSIRFGGGSLELPADRPALKDLADSAFIRGGLKQHSLTELNRILRGKTYSISFNVGDDAFHLSGSCASDALETQLQVCTAYLAAPGYRPEARQVFLDRIEAAYAQNEHTAEGVLCYDVYSFLHSDDPRFGFPSREAMRAVSMGDIQAWLAGPLATGYLEMAIVGDIDPEVALQLAAKTVGALPRREASKPAFATGRDVKYPLTPKSKAISFSSEVQRGISVVTWPTWGNRNMARERRIGVLATVLHDRLRLKVRQELGATYSPNVECVDNDAFRDYGHVISVLTVEPKKAAEIGSLVKKLAADLATGSISDDEFQRAIQPTLSSLDQVDRDNGHWIGLLSACQERPFSLEDERERKADYRAITKSEIESLAKQVFAADRATIINVIPAPQTATTK
jgi:zinc protease